MRLEAQKLCCGYGTKKKVVDQADLCFESGQVLCLLGPNGSGKTTFFKTVLGFLKPLSGSLLCDGRDMLRMTRAELARAIAYVPQSHTAAFPFRVIDMVTMGRTAHLGTFASPSRKDAQLAHEALDELGIAQLAGQPFTEISGGERQLVLIARAMAQQAGLMIMDEPTSNLDFGNQIRVLGHIRKLALRGIGVLLTTHFPSHALLCADLVAIMHHGVMRVAGAPRETITETSLKEIYGVEAHLFDWVDPQGRRIDACVPVLN